MGYKKRNTQMVLYTGGMTTTASTIGLRYSDISESGLFKRKSGDLNETSSKKSREDNTDNQKDESEKKVKYNFDKRKSNKWNVEKQRMADKMSKQRLRSKWKEEKTSM